ncbi:MAG: septum formation initiator family protein [Chitinispirillales bacterium]|jgi:cell division protein FtsB|nr:septum formation initiator family protein [Chitinispirillales bacterium]
MKRNRKLLLIVASIVAVGVLILLTVSERGFLDMYRLHREDKGRIQEIKAARMEIDSLKTEIERLRNDTAHIERVARERLGMARKGEKVFKFVEENGN